MPDTLASKDRVARKEHICSYCGAVIASGEKYAWEKLKYDGEIYEWKAHKECEYIAQAIWEYVDPDCGMTGDDFMEGAADVCRAFICPDCQDPCKEEGDCYVCLHKVYDLLQTHDLVRVRDKHGWGSGYEAVLRK